MRHIFIALIMVMLVCIKALASDFMLTNENTQRLTLEQAQSIAIKNYPQITAAEAKTKIAKEHLSISRSKYLPQVDGNATRVTSRNNNSLSALENNLGSPSAINRGSLGTGVTQLITDFGHTTDLIESSKLELQATKSRSKLTYELVLLNVTCAYYNALRAEALLQVAKSTLKTENIFLQRTSLLYKTKLKSSLDLSIASQLVDAANLLLLQATDTVNDSQAILSEALGYNKTYKFILLDVTKTPPPPIDVDVIITLAMDNNPELAAINAEHNSAQKKAEAAEKAGYPVVSAIGYAGMTPVNNSSQPVTSHSLAAGISVNIPFYTGGRILAQNRSAVQNAIIAKQDLIGFRNQLRRDIHITFSKVQTSYQRIMVTAKLLKNANETLELIQKRYEVGSSSIVDLDQAQLAQTQAQIENANAIYEYFINRALLDYKIGNKLSASFRS